MQMQMSALVTLTTRKALEVVAAKTIVAGICVVLPCLLLNVLKERIANGSGTIIKGHTLLRLI